MGLHYDIDTAGRQVGVTGSGKLTMPEIVATVEQIALDAGFRSDFPVVFDFRDAAYTAEFNDGNQFVALLARREKDFQNRLAIVVPRHLYGLVQLYCLLARTKGIDRITCFTDIEEARAWCGLAK